MHLNRRDFLRKSLAAALGGAGLFSALGNLRVVAAAANQGRYRFGDYKALVCIFLGGGNDSFNSVVPYSSSEYNAYRQSRNGLAGAGGLALQQAAVQAQNLDALALAAGLPGGPPSDGGSYGLHPSLAPLRALFNGGQMAIVANVGTLRQPTTQAQYQAGTVPLPPQLFSHDDQSICWQTARPDDANADGWGGRIADLLYSANSGPAPMSISLSNENRFLRAALVNPYAMDASGVDKMSYLGDGSESWIMGDNPGGAAAYNALIAEGTQTHVLERAYAQAASAAIDNYQIVSAALDAAAPLATPFPDTDLGAQLKMVARLIGVRAALGMSRQVFYLSTGDYDTHDGQIDTHADNLGQLAQALAAFQAATIELAVANQVTAFTASDFGRSLAVNGDGTDHGWGGHHFVIGGAVRGRRFYGRMPSLLQSTQANPLANPDDTGHGQIIPTTSVDQYAATLASWFGVGNSDIADIFPNLHRFDASNLRFMG
ncbi:uncharacterized protein (DUF1501 family) [Tahibacter aquaticus]|uniref:Uncharacterized protein (DUF1501 family) n=1 Tax=Tahibacter aquaticus TaxID=520092 RepID=A0A4R6YQ98_9GAMM|nr:DUF1501 domain-containing protein [Tahibacter aquaticus]TDR40060.1 uncharacterized protein (DUF1501 family) [Tahibacter aquaticus]